MEILAYFESVEDRLLSDPLILNVDFVDRWQTEVNGYIRFRVTFANQQHLEFSEYVQRGADGQVHIITYTYQWMSTDFSLLCRWDNTPHFRELPGFPCHRHDGAENDVFADKPRSVFTVLDEIGRRNA